MRFSQGKIIYNLLYVDDLFIISSYVINMIKLKEKLYEKIEMSKLSEKKKSHYIFKK